MTRAAFPSWGGGGGGGGGGKEREICCGASPASPVQVDCSDVTPGCLEVVSQIGGFISSGHISIRCIQMGGRNNDFTLLRPYIFFYITLQITLEITLLVFT